MCGARPASSRPRACPATANARILLLHLFPNILPPMVVQVSLNMGWAILNAAGLSFIGLGVRPPTPEWGIMVAEGAHLHRLRRVVGGAVPGRGADARGVLLQPAGRRAARSRRPAEADDERRSKAPTLRLRRPPVTDGPSSTSPTPSSSARAAGIVHALERRRLQRRQGRDRRRWSARSGSGKSVPPMR